MLWLVGTRHSLLLFMSIYVNTSVVYYMHSFAISRDLTAWNVVLLDPTTCLLPHGHVWPTSLTFGLVRPSQASLEQLRLCRVDRFCEVALVGFWSFFLSESL